MTTQLREAIARLRRILYVDPRTGADTMLVCDALEAHLKPAPKFDKVTYQREYMRKKRKRAKLIRDSSRWLPPA
jgi:DNA-binding FadR family transcriptional regulator